VADNIQDNKITSESGEEMGYQDFKGYS